MKNLFICIYLSALAWFLTSPQNSLAQDSITARTPLVSTPSTWLQHTENAIILFEGKLLTTIDTSFMDDKYPRLVKDKKLVLHDFDSTKHAMRIRTLDDVKANLLQLKSEIEKWRNSLRRQSTALTDAYLEIHRLQSDTAAISSTTDSLIKDIYSEQLAEVEADLSSTEKKYRAVILRIATIENTLNTTYYELSKGIMLADAELRQRRATLFHRTHAPLWDLTPSTYVEGIGSVFMATVKRNLASLEFYAKNAYIRVIIFRVAVLLITLIPIVYFRKNKRKLQKPDQNQTYKFVHKHTGAATSSFVLVMAPFIFVNSPHLVTEVILVTLAFTTVLIFLKENPGISRTNMYALLAIYVILKAMNLMISVTFLGRIVWTLSLLALVPLYGFLRSIRFSSLERKGLMWLIIILSGSMYVAGWVLNLTGHYPLGRILQIAGLDQFFLAIVLYVATFSLIDFLAIVANMYNSSGKMTTIRIDLIYRKLLNLVRFLAVSLWFYTFLVNINALEFLKDNVFNLLSTTFSVASFTFTPGGLLVFFIILYFSFYISGLMDGLFYDEKRTNETGGKTSLGSIVLMLRLFIIAVGFIMGLVIAGIPLNSLNLFVGALGVGIGFGLQSLIANMISGLVIAFEKPIYVGDIVEVDGIHGKVTDIGLRATKIDTFNGSEHIIPNSEFVSKTLKNWTFTSRHYRIESSFVVSHRHDPQTVLAMADEVIKSTGFVLRHPEPKVYIKQIEGSGVRFMISCWIGNISEANHLTSEILKRLHEKFDKAGITYPHDIRIDDNG